jgi:hypothetical protein
VADDLALCIGGEQVTGLPPAVSCDGQVLLVEAVPLWIHPAPRPAPFRVYACGAHLPAGLPLRLASGHPVAVWDWLCETTRGESWTSPSARSERMDAAMKAAHGIDLAAPNIAVRNAEGHDARTAYRWSLSYLRAYAALLADGDDDDPDQLARDVAHGRARAAATDAEIVQFIQAALF